MLTVKECRDQLREFGDPITEVLWYDPDWLDVRLRNPQDPNDPYQMFVHPIWIDEDTAGEAHGPGILRMRVKRITYRRGRDLIRALFEHNCMCAIGATGMDRRGDIYYQVLHLCHDGNHPSEDMLSGLIHNIAWELSRIRDVLAQFESRSGRGRTHGSLTGPTRPPELSAPRSGPITQAEVAALARRLAADSVKPTDLFPDGRSRPNPQTGE